MKHLIYFDDFLAESVLDIDTIYTKYYNMIDRYVFDKIIEADPTTVLKDSKMGVYCKWLLKLYSNGKLLIEDLYKATNYISAFHQFKHKISQKDINYYKSLPELFKVVEPYLEKEESKFENDEERKLAGQFKEVFRNEEYRIIIPLTLKASKYFGRDTEWCTLNTNEFKKYTKKQSEEITIYNLYILYTEDSFNKYQFHFNARQFMNDYDMAIETQEFFDKHKDIYNFFNKYFKVDKYITDSKITWTENSLIGSPSIVEGSFECRGLDLKSLVGGPSIVDFNYHCTHNQLENLKGAPKSVGGWFDCSYNTLTSLVGSPKTSGSHFECRYNKLTSLIGGPETVDGNFDCGYNRLVTLEGAPKSVGGWFICTNNPNLPLDEIKAYYATGAVTATLHSDYGYFTDGVFYKGKPYPN